MSVKNKNGDSFELPSIETLETRLASWREHRRSAETAIGVAQREIEETEFLLAIARAAIPGNVVIDSVVAE